MGVFDLVTPEELAELPEDSSKAFLFLVERAQAKLVIKERALGNDEWQEVQSLRFSFVNFVLACAKNFEIEPLASMDVPRLTNFNNEIFIQLSMDIDFVITQILVNNSRKNRADSTYLDDSSRSKIRAYVHGLRDCIDKSNITGKMKSSLLIKLAAFEAELDKKRINFAKLALLLAQVMCIPGGLWSSAQIATKLATDILQIVGEQKTIDEDRNDVRLLPSRPVALLPRPPESTTEELDGDIPF